ncbi:MAG: YafY family protein [bacterium]|nr:YafY family protein [bacterium]
MNRTDRLLAIVLELQAKGEQRAEDLAATFETSKRTIYRDMMALCEAGVPVIAIPGRGFSLDEGYFLPPLNFTTDEATILLLGAGVMAKSFDSEYEAAAQAAAQKLSQVLPTAQREKAEWGQAMFYFVPAHDSQESDFLRQLRSAILKAQMVRFEYHARFSEDGDQQPLLRQVNPYGLVRVADKWILVGYCHLRQGIRNFRLSRMEKLTVLPQRFTRQKDVMIQHGSRGFEDMPLTVQLLFDANVARWVEEDGLFFITGREQTERGLLVTLRVRHEREILQWVLGWGSAVQVLEPPSLRERLAQEARIMLEKHTKNLLP